MDEESDKMLIEFAAATERLSSPSPLRKYVIAAGAAALLVMLLQMLAAAAGIDGAKLPLWTLSMVTLLLLIGSGITLYLERTRTYRRCRQLAYAIAALDEDRSA